MEDNEDRIRAFEKAIAAIDGNLELKVWRNAPAMLAECEAFLNDAGLISLDHDLNPLPGETADPGDGMVVARFFSQFPQMCPIILHSSNYERMWSMHNELHFAGWEIERVGPIGDDWIWNFWLPKAKELLTATNKYSGRINKPQDHVERMARVKLSLDGLSVGDGFGECFFCDEALIEDRLSTRSLPPAPWFVTDDTIMTLSVVENLERFGEINRDVLARAFGERYRIDPRRGYGGTAHSILRHIGEGMSWERASRLAFDGMGSMGNGGAMRSAPIGAYFADDVDAVIKQANYSAEVTHAHPDGRAGAVAVALAAAWVVVNSEKINADGGKQLLAFCHELTPDGPTRQGLKKAMALPLECSVRTAVSALGNGSQVISADTVPFALWCAARHLNNYTEALWATVSGRGDRDTTCAMVGGIIALATGHAKVPPEWLECREALPW